MIFADGRLDPESFRDGADRRQDGRVPALLQPERVSAEAGNF
jgi:hypothetical protein